VVTGEKARKRTNARVPPTKSERDRKKKVGFDRNGKRERNACEKKTSWVEGACKKASAGKSYHGVELTTDTPQKLVKKKPRFKLKRASGKKKERSAVRSAWLEKGVAANKG